MGGEKNIVRKKSGYVAYPKKVLPIESSSKKLCFLNDAFHLKKKLMK